MSLNAPWGPMPPEFVYTEMDPGPDVGIDCSGDPVYTQQSFAEEADINVLMARYEKTGGLVDPRVVPTRQPFYGDFSEGLDYLDAQNRVLEARGRFDALPARIRDYFRNDPVEFLHFVGDPANMAEGARIGLWKVPPSPGEPVKADAGTSPESPKAEGVAESKRPEA